MRFLSLLGCIFLIASASVFAQSRGTIPSLAPIVIQEMGQAEVNYGPTIFPEFSLSGYSSSAEKCANACLDVSGKPIIQRALGAPFGFKPILSTKVNFRGRRGIGRAYQKDTNIFVTWTVRVVGDAVFIPIPRVCQALGIGGRWAGYAYEEFKGGKVYTRLMVNGQQRGNTAIMTIPFKGGIGRFTPSDPTILGSALLRPEDFGGKFPNYLDFEVQWLNNTSLIIASPLDKAGNTTRNLVVTIMPVQD